MEIIRVGSDDDLEENRKIETKPSRLRSKKSPEQKLATILGLDGILANGAIDSKQLRDLISHYLTMTRKQFKETYLGDKADDMPMLDSIICAIIETTVARGDIRKLDFLLNRSGLILDKTLNINHIQNAKSDVVVEMDDQQIIDIMAKF